MPSMQEIELQSKVLVELLKPMAKQLEEFKTQNSELNSQVAALGKQLHEVRQEYELFKSQQKSIDIDEIATAAAAKIVVKDGVDGRDGSVDDLIPLVAHNVEAFWNQVKDALVDEIKSSIPSPKDGADGQSVSIDDVLPVLLPEIKNYTQELVSAIPAPKDGRDGIDGVDGKSVNIDELTPAVVSMLKSEVLPELMSETAKQVEDLVASIPVPVAVHGKDGIDGKSVTVDDVLDSLKEQVIPVLKDHAAELVSAIPAPEPIPGKDGKHGVDGVDGKSVALDDVLPALKSEILPVLKDHAEELVAHIKLPEPIHGKDGVDGKSVEVKDIEPIINELVKKAADSLPPSKNGVDGKDATDITILPEIDFSKNYPRGVWAHHKGGLWKSHSATNGERGWDCVVNGVESVKVEKHSERDISIVINQSNGETVEKTFYQPALIYKGIYDEKRDKEYVEGDTVTCGGSVWYCKCDNPGRPSNENRNWQLAVKHGQHGKDGRNGIDYTKPVTVGSS